MSLEDFESGAWPAPGWVAVAFGGSVRPAAAHDGWSAGAAGLSPIIDAHHAELIARADGLLLIGWDPVELRDHWMPGWTEAAEVVRLDTHEPTDLPCAIDRMHLGPLPASVRSLADAIQRPASAWQPAEVEAHREAWQAELQEEGLSPAGVVRAVQAAAPEDAVVCVDTGAHRITAANAWCCERPDRLLMSTGLASMGYALPAALAAAAASHPAICLCGDMGLQMVAGELGLAAEADLSLVIVVSDDRSLALIELKQRRLELPPDGVRFGNPDWGALISAFGGRHHPVRSAGELQRALREGLEGGGLHLVSVPIDPAAYHRQV